MLKSIAKTLGLSILLVASLAMSTIAQEISWQTDLDKANQLAAKEGKLVLLHFTADWCRPCKTLETFVFSSSVVQGAVDKNVIPVKVDVDLHSDLVSEYAISGVPADVVITPTGRVVTKRNSPSTIDGYANMIKGLSKILAGLDGGNSTVEQNLAELKEKLQPKKVAGANDFRPKAPSHTAPKIPTNGAVMARNSGQVLKNPFFQASDSKPAIATTSKKSVIIKNEFEPYTSRRSPLKPAEPAQEAVQAQVAQAQVAQAEIATTTFQDDRQQQNLLQPSAPTRKPQPTGAALAKLDEQSISNQYFARENAKMQANATFRAGQDNQSQGSGSLVSTALDKVDEVDRSMFALHGKCPVTLMTEARWVNGNKQFGCVHRGRTYLFVSKLHLTEFQAEPDKYSPLLAGYDPVVYHEQGELVEGLEENGVFMGKLPNQRIILFQSAETRAKFQDNPRNYIETVRQAMLSSATAGSKQIR